MTAGAKLFRPHPLYGWTHEPGAEGWTNGCIGRAFEWRAFSRINAEGLRRRGFAAADILAVRRAYKTLYREGRTLDDAKEALGAAARTSPSLAPLVEFLAVPGRGIVRG